MTLIAEAEKNQVVLINSLTVFGSDGIQLVFVLLSCKLRIDFAAHTHDRFFRNASRHKKIFARHSEVALWIIRRHATLVSKREANRLPRKIMCLRCDPVVNRCWSVSARERDPKFVALSDSFVPLFEDQAGSVGNKILSANDFGTHAHLALAIGLKFYFVPQSRDFGVRARPRVAFQRRMLSCEQSARSPAFSLRS